MQELRESRRRRGDALLIADKALAAAQSRIPEHAETLDDVAAAGFDAGAAHFGTLVIDALIKRGMSPANVLKIMDECDTRFIEEDMLTEEP